MPPATDNNEFWRELFAPLGLVQIKRMFGGAGVYIDGTMCALIADEVLYLKVDDENRPAFIAQNLAAFSYTRRGKVVQLSYYRAPDAAMDAPAQMLPWARSALGAALRSRHPDKPVPSRTT